MPAVQGEQCNPGATLWHPKQPIKYLRTHEELATDRKDEIMSVHLFCDGRYQFSTYTRFASEVTWAVIRRLSNAHQTYFFCRRLNPVRESCQPILLAAGCCAPCDVLQRGSRGVREEDMHSFGLAPTVGQTDQLLVSGPQTPIHTGLIISVIITDSRVPEYIENVTWSIWANQCLFLIQP